MNDAACCNPNAGAIPLKERAADSLLLAGFLMVSLTATLALVGADTGYDETIYAEISRSVWQTGRPTVFRRVDHRWFADNPALVPAVLSPIAGATDSLPALRLGHWAMFVLPGNIALFALVRPAGRTAVAVACAMLLLNRFQVGAAARISLDQGLASWGLIAIACFVSERHTLLGLVAIVVATLCKYQSVVVCLTLAVAAAFERLGFRRLALYGLASGVALCAWVGLLLANGGGGDFVAHGDRFGWQNYLLTIEGVRGTSLTGLVWLAVTDLSIPVLLLATVGLVRNRSNRLLRVLACYLGLTVLFNFIAAALPGGFTSYLKPAYLPLAILAGWAFAGQRWPLTACLLLVGTAGAIPFFPWALPFAVKGAAAAALIGAVICFRYHALGTWLLLAACVCTVLPFGIEPSSPLRTPDPDVRELVERARAGGLQVGSWEDPRVHYYYGRPGVEACMDTNWEQVDCFVLQTGDLTPDRPDDPLNSDHVRFLAYLHAEYERDGQAGNYISFRRKSLAGR